MIIKHKEFPNKRVYEIDYCGRPLRMEIGRMCELANAAVLTQYGETTVLVAVTASPRPRDGIDYFPLSVDFNEKLYAVGRIPGSFMRREGRPSLPAVLASRLIDRPMRPLFPSDLRNDVAIQCEVLSVDRDCSPEITAMIGASAAVAISDIPWNGPIAGISLGWDGEKYLFNPTKAERETNKMTVTVAATHKKVVMIEAAADQVPDEVMYEGIVQAHEKVQPVLDLIDKMVEEIGKPKFEYEHADFNEELFNKIVESTMDEAMAAMDTDDKNVREERWNKLIEHWHEMFLEEYPEMDKYLEEITYKFQKKIVKKWLLEGHRVDGRAMNEIRPLAAEVGVIPPRPRQRPLHPRPDSGAQHSHPQHPLHEPEAGHHLGRGREALHAPLQLPRLLHRRGEAAALHRPPRVRPRRPGREGPRAPSSPALRTSPTPSAW